MIVLDTSAAIELLLSLPLSRKVQDLLDEHDWVVAAPELLQIEVLQVLRRRVTSGVTSIDDAEYALNILRDINVRYFNHEVLIDRVWELRSNLTAYDASYVALAELLDGNLVTSDARLAHAPGNNARILLVN